MFRIVGDFFGSTGYAVHTRQLANALNKLKPVSVTSNLPPDWMRQVNDRELEMFKRPIKKEDINIIITLPIYWKMNITNGRNWAYVVWEGDKVPKCFIEECLNPDIEYILVPSNHTKQAILNTMLEMTDKIPLKEYPGITFEMDGGKITEFNWNKIKVIHHGVDLNLFYPKEKPTKCTFIANKGLRGPEDRGGIQYLIKAYMEEFTDEDVELLIKINPAYGIIDVNKLIAEMVDKKEIYPKISINAENMKYEDLVKFYNKGNVFVSPTRSEAFNIPCIEAMACGLPVLTTNFGGQTDFVDGFNSWIVSGKLTEVKWDLMYEGISWLTPDLLQLKQKLRWIYENQDLVKQKSEKAIETANKYTWDNSAKQLIALI